jgi:hypothetical protein
MTNEIMFDLPDDEDAADGAPDTIMHGIDYMKEPDGNLMYHYNYLVYSWTIDGEAEPLRARSYFDEIGEVSVFMPFKRFQSPKFAAVLRYLQRRYAQIDTFEAGDSGYVQRYKLRPVRTANSSGPSPCA